jgi:uncharacterized membrane protein YphA (DoxX/SURF4 family)
MLDTTLWIAQVFLALFFLAAGLPKVLGRGIDRWVGFDRVPRPLTVLIGVSEVAAAVGLVVPMLVDELQWTTPLAAMGLATVCAMAAGFHLREQEWLPALETVLWSSLATVVVIGRWDELSTGPSISTDVLVPVVGLLVVAILVNLAILFRQPLPEPTAESMAS